MKKKAEHYTISVTEIARRKTAFVKLGISLIAGSVVASFDIIRPNPGVSILVVSIMLFAFIIILILLFRSFNSFSRLVITLDDEALIRNSGKNTEVYSLSDIKSMRVKRTTKRTAREIKITFDNGDSIFINGLSRFAEFEKNLYVKAPKEATISTINEILDFDHPLFYIILGSILGVSSVFLAKTIIAFEGAATYLSLFSVIGGFALSAFVFIKRPISQRYGEKTQRSDLLFSLFLFFLSYICFYLITSFHIGI